MPSACDVRSHRGKVQGAPSRCTTFFCTIPLHCRSTSRCITVASRIIVSVAQYRHVIASNLIWKQQGKHTNQIIVRAMGAVLMKDDACDPRYGRHEENRGRVSHHAVCETARACDCCAERPDPEAVVAPHTVDFPIRHPARGLHKVAVPAFAGEALLSEDNPRGSPARSSHHNQSQSCGMSCQVRLWLRAALLNGKRHESSPRICPSFMSHAASNFLPRSARTFSRSCPHIHLT